MGLLVRFNAAVHRVLIGLDCMDSYEFEQCGGEYGKEEDGPWPSYVEELRAKTGAENFGDPDALREKCRSPDGEFAKYKVALNNEVIHSCEMSGDYAPLDALEDGDAYDEARASALEHFSRYGLSSADLKQRPKTLAMMILKMTKRQATKMQASALKKA